MNIIWKSVHSHSEYKFFHVNSYFPQKSTSVWMSTSITKKHLNSGRPLFIFLCILSFFFCAFSSFYPLWQKKKSKCPKNWFCLANSMQSTHLLLKIHNNQPCCSPVPDYLRLVKSQFLWGSPWGRWWWCSRCHACHKAWKISNVC